MINSAALAIIKTFEGCKLNAYLCPANVVTIGYGHTRGVKLGDTITQQQADELLLKDIEKFERGIEKILRVKVTDSQFGALVSLAFNIGLTALANSTLMQKLNNGDFNGASNEFLRWNKAAGKVLSGLTKRREAERGLFLK